MSFIERRVMDIRCDMCDKAAPQADNTPRDKDSLREEAFSSGWFQVDFAQTGLMDICSDVCLRKLGREWKKFLDVVTQCQQLQISWREEMRKDRTR